MSTFSCRFNAVLWIALVCLMVAVACSSNKGATTTTSKTTTTTQTSQTVQPATQPPQTTQTPQTTQKAPGGDPGAFSIMLTAKNMAFDKKTITVPAGASVTMTFDNKDAGVPHNFALYQDSSAAKAIFVGEIITGPSNTTYTFTAPSTPGNYFFRCDVHPTSMTGTFVVK